MALEDMRREYRISRLDEAGVAADPIAQFRTWLEQACRTADGAWYEPNAMVLATVEAGRPDARVVLLKEVDADALVFYTNLYSAKARQLADDPSAAVAFHWPWLERQVRVRGTVEPLPRERAEGYFGRRPRGSQLGAHASRQSQVVAGRSELDERRAEVADRFAGQDVPMPSDWGGFRLVVESVEFWQGRENRLHDRLRYRRTSDGWTLERLSP